MGTKNNPGDYDCYQHAHPDEPMFVLLGRDPLGGLLVRLWAEARAELGETSEAKLSEAYRCADAMRRWAIDERKSVAIAKAALHKVMSRRVDPLSEGNDLPPELDHPANKMLREANRRERVRAAGGDEARVVASDRVAAASCEHPVSERRLAPAPAGSSEAKEVCGVCLSYRWREIGVDGGEWSGWRR
jgi:hypothetical protein